MSLRVVGGHQLEAGNLHELAFQRRGDVIRHRLRRGARIIHLHLDHRVIDGRKIAHRQLEISDQPKENDGDAQRNRHYRTTNEKFGKIHECAS